MIPLSGRVPGRAYGPSRSRVDDGGDLQFVLWKLIGLFRFSVLRRIYRKKGGVRRWARRPHHLLAQARGRPRHPMVRLAPGPPPSLLWTPSRVRKNRNFGFCFVQFREYFLCSFSETQKHQNRELALWHLVNRLVLKMNKNATKCNKTQSKWCINKHGASIRLRCIKPQEEGMMSTAASLPSV
jgi:hypothetical protein